jgi:hypothetical protein
MAYLNVHAVLWTAMRGHDGYIVASGILATDVGWFGNIRQSPTCTRARECVIF